MSARRGSAPATNRRVNTTPTDQNTVTPPRLWKRAAAIIAAVVSGISFVTGIVAVIPILTKDATKFDSLKIEAEEFRPAVLQFAVPVGAPFESFPTSTSLECGPDQQAWLARFGERYSSQFMITFQNNASEGAMLALANFRGVGERKMESTEAIRVECDTAGMAPSKLLAARLELGVEGEIAYFDDSLLPQSDLPDAPVILNLAPGEGAQLLLQLRSGRRFTGDINVTVKSGADFRDVLVPLADDVTVPASIARGDVFLRVQGTLDCVTHEDGVEADCSLADVLGE